MRMCSNAWRSRRPQALRRVGQARSCHRNRRSSLVVAATTAAVAGLPHGMELAPLLRELMVTSWYGNRGGSGIVLRPSTLVNLYHWVFGESHYMRNSIGVPLPIADLPYDTDEGRSTALTPGGTGG
jgi:hypothetical protein